MDAKFPRRRGAMLLSRLLAVLALLAVPALAWGQLGRVGIYVYENLEGYHSASSTSGNVLVGRLLSLSQGAVSFDRIPLQSNETVRILSEMTEDRKVVLTPLTSWLSGGVIVAPTVTIADDAIKFKDLTWHLDLDAVLADARGKGLDQVIVGTITGQVRDTGQQAATTGSRLASVTVQANLQLIDLASGEALWARPFRQVKAGFDPRVAFDEGILAVAEEAAADLTAAYTE